MRNHLIGLFAIGLLFPAISLAQTEVEPQSSARIGYGYDTKTDQLFPKGGGCVEVGQPEPGEKTALDNSVFFNVVESWSELVDTFDLGLGVKLKVAAGAADIKAGVDLSISKGTEVSKYSKAIVAKVTVNDNPMFVNAAEIRLKQKWIDKLAEPGGKKEFTAACGDSFIIGTQKGFRFRGSVTVKKQDGKSWDNMNLGVDVSVANKKGDGVNVNLDIAKKMEKRYGKDSLEIRATSSDSAYDKNPTTTADLVQMYEKANSGDGGKKMLVKMYVGSYSQWADGYPGQGSPLATTVDEDDQEALVNALWDLREIVNQADTIRKNDSHFAMGTGKTRKAVLANVKSKFKKWDKEFRALKTAVLDNKCGDRLNKKCRQLAKDYRDIDAKVPILARLSGLPTLYTSNCASKVRIKRSGLFKGGKKIVLSEHAAGDKDIGGAKMILAGDLTFKRKKDIIYAEVISKVIEDKPKKGPWKNKIYHTAYKGTNSEAVFNLAKQPKLKQCAFASKLGLKGVKNIKSVLNKKRKVHGTYRAKGQPTNKKELKVSGKNIKGQLVQIKCKAKRKNVNKGSAYCHLAATTQLTADLVNKADLERDKLHKSKKNPKPALSAAAKTLRNKRGATRKQRVKRKSKIARQMKSGKKSKKGKKAERARKTKKAKGKTGKYDCKRAAKSCLALIGKHRDKCLTKVSKTAGKKKHKCRPSKFIKRCTNKCKKAKGGPVGKDACARKCLQRLKSKLWK